MMSRGVGVTGFHNNRIPNVEEVIDFAFYEYCFQRRRTKPVALPVAFLFNRTDQVIFAILNQLKKVVLLCK